MKRCPNPNCNSEILYSNDKVTCPFCHSTLTGGFNAGDSAGITPIDVIQIADERRNGDQEEQNTQDTFWRQQLNRIECHGRITEIDHQTRFNSRSHKIINALFRGEPYQFAHETAEYVIRVENLSDDVATQTRDFCLYGSYLGRMQVGDEVRIVAKDKGNRRIVKSIYNETTGSQVRAGLQIPAIWIRCFYILFGPVLLAVLGIWWIIKNIFLGGGRR